MTLRQKLARVWRLGWIAILCLSFAYGLLAWGVHVRESMVRSRSEALYAEFLKLQPEKTTRADIEALRSRWSGFLVQDSDCGATDCEYKIGNVWGYSPWLLLTRLAHDHQPSSELTLKTSGNLLSSASFSVGVLVPKGYGTREERKRLRDPNYVPYSTGDYQLFGRASVGTRLPDPCCNSQLTPEKAYRIWGPSGCMNCLAIWVSALPTLERAKRAQVFQIDFDCMTQWSMCTDKEDIMPVAGREYAEHDAGPD